MTEKYRITNKGRIAPNGYRLCDPLKEGIILQDQMKKEWVVGKTIGCGGFGEIYLCHEKKDPSKTYVMKLDNVTGPLFVEVNFAIRALKTATIKSFMSDKKLSFLGIPEFVSSGTATVGSAKYRFLIMERLGEELQKVLETTRLSIGLICRIASRIIDALEYIHEQGFIHADIKAQNILRSSVTTNDQKRGKRVQEDIEDVKDDDKYYLIDFGLVEKYTFQGLHKPNELDKRTANNGTCEFRSRDAHIGVISRRSDIESLGFNLILWFYGRHPWADLIKNPDKVHQKKIWAMNNINDFLKEAFNPNQVDSSETKATPNKTKAPSKKNIPTVSAPPKGLNKLFEEIKSMAHDEKPNYVKLKQILNEIATLNSGDSVLAKSNGNKKKASSTVSSAKKTISKRKSDEIDSDIIDAALPVKTRKALTLKVPLKSKSNQVLVNGHTNGALENPSDFETEDDDDSIYEPIKKASVKSKTKLKTSNGKVTNSRTKRKVSSNGKNSKPLDSALDDGSKSRTLRNRVKLDDDFSDETEYECLLNEDNYNKNNKANKTPKRKLPRLSTPLIMMTPPEGDESPLGSFEPSDSIKENRNFSNGKTLNNNLNIVQEDDETETDAMRAIRVYINNKRCSEKSSKDKKGSTARSNASSIASESSDTSVEAINDTKPVQVNGKLKLRNSISSKSKQKPNGLHKLNGKVKVNGHTPSPAPPALKSTPATRRNRKAQALFGPEELVTISPNHNRKLKSNPINETPAMRKLRMKIEAKRNAPATVVAKK